MHTLIVLGVKFYGCSFPVEIRHDEGRNETTKFLEESKVDYSLMMMFLTMNIGYAQKRKTQLL
jgi:hypothetical protein